MTLTRERLTELLSYNPETGEFRWLIRPKKSKNPVGSVAGTIKDRNAENKYLLIWVDGLLHRAHRLAWLCTYGSWPAKNIDHINGDGTDNRLSNLRECNQQQNNGNHRRLNRTNTSGFRGVTWKSDRKKWKAFININNRQTHVGYFDTKEAAYEAYRIAAIKHFGEFARV